MFGQGFMGGSGSGYSLSNSSAVGDTKGGNFSQGAINFGNTGGGVPPVYILIAVIAIVALLLVVA